MGTVDEDFAKEKYFIFDMGLLLLLDLLNIGIYVLFVYRFININILYCIGYWIIYCIIYCFANIVLQILDYTLG